MQEIVQLERDGWQALAAGDGRAFYGRMLTPDAVMVVPGAVLARDQVLASWDGTPPWIEHRIDDAQVSRLASDVALLIYKATARRADEAPYQALISSIYRHTDEGWRLAFHQQTPVEQAML